MPRSTTSDAGDAGSLFCPPSGTAIDSGVVVVPDAGTVDDAGTAITDAGPSVTDGGSSDAGATDAGAATDAGTTTDAGSAAAGQTCLPRLGYVSDGGVECSFDECGTSSDCCNSTQSCVFALPLCAVCSGTVCTGPTDCVTGQVCQAVGDDGACRCANGPVQICVDSCSASGSCPVGDTCSSSGACVPSSCVTQGYQCGAWATCATGSVQGDRHGCAGIACRVDTDCVGGFCLNSVCHQALGTCQ